VQQRRRQLLRPAEAADVADLGDDKAENIVELLIAVCCR
jgi:hypothetical protein